MTGQEAIAYIKAIKNGLHETGKDFPYRDEIIPVAKEALDMAIKALEQEPCEDAISRQAAMDAMYALCDTGETIKENPWRDNPHIDAITDAIDELPPVTPQPKMGRWIVNEWGNISCSECGCTALYDKVYPGESVFGKAIRVKSNFCPTCGAKMKGSKR